MNYTTKKPSVVMSSANPNNYSLTLKGAAVILTLYLFNQAGVDFSETDIAILIEAVAIITGSLWTVFGFVRKLYYK